MMQHATIAFDLEKSGEEALYGAIRRLPVGGRLKLTGSGVSLTRIGGGRLYAFRVGPKARQPIHIDPASWKSAQTAAPALAAAHREVIGQEGDH